MVAPVAVHREQAFGVAADTVTAGDETIRVVADQGSAGRIDWTLDDGRGTTLRRRHRVLGRVARVTLVDARHGHAALAASGGGGD
ncbi:hypothetical protein [Actinomycetospora straminea]|uniref:Uncharacterized protein n=1 Tax=Actinomycetospora straminea TaxID=663607 RepID=A0ABP9DVR5_9PSEU|nr:hypothetical protein [Actinomycetospora straminea]MDD7935216.1 hypothetical protein [Actinomycetospora straminea]